MDIVDINHIESDIQKAHMNNTSKSWELVYQRIKYSDKSKKDISGIIENLFPNIVFKLSHNRVLIDFLDTQNLRNFSKLCRVLTEINDKKNNPSKCKKLKKYKGKYRWKLSNRGRVVEVRNNNINTIEDITYTHDYDTIDTED